MQWETTTILLERLRDSEDLAWNRFMERFRTPMFRFARRCGLNESRSEDAVQDTLLQFIEAYRAGSYDRSRGRLGSWLFTLMYQSIRSHQRDQARDPVQSPRLIDRTTFFAALPDEDTAKEIWDQDWEHHTMKTCLEHMRNEVSPTHFRAFELTTMREVPAAEVAQQLQLTRDTVYQVRYRLLKRLQELKATFNASEELAS